MEISKQKIKAVCFGEVLFDNFPTYSKIGGALLNVSVRLKSLGVDVSMISCVGDDSNGKEIIRYLKKKGIDTSGILVQHEYPTGLVNVLLDKKGVASYDIPYPVAWDKIVMLETYKDLVKDNDVIIFGSLACRHAITRSTLKSILKHVHYKVFDVNLRVPHYTYELLIDLMKESNFIKFNDDELFEVADYLGCKNNSIEQIISFIAKVSGTDSICVTKGAYGAVLYTKGNFYYNSGYRIKVLDTVGAGDSFLASVVYKLMNGDGPQDALNFGCAVGALIAGGKGANPKLSKHKIYKFMNP
ncbi:carbohydrate kinase family protein [Maribacter hydrothermalis]|uniref:Carbohydrate kinase n=1 Tax=Maribacter hydrothermalis TaxID=1836467 RepID=A0A1B7ZFC1_9FLAO|nr:carbohydrate kinase [Maribacter hydrothermalis]APQ17774.1 carbohydrate kinase [Maribacter hydrothermalis]OBR42248.1 carbohydrate kinase [Maribacter hydrothermalis]